MRRVELTIPTPMSMFGDRPILDFYARMMWDELLTHANMEPADPAEFSYIPHPERFDAIIATGNAQDVRAEEPLPNPGVIPGLLTGPQLITRYVREVPEGRTAGEALRSLRDFSLDLQGTWYPVTSDHTVIERGRRSEYDEMRTHTEDQIRAIFGIPPSGAVPPLGPASTARHQIDIDIDDDEEYDDEAGWFDAARWPGKEYE